MPITFEEVRTALGVEEPNYKRIAGRLGLEALPHLEKLLGDVSIAHAAQAAYLVGVLGSAQAVPILLRAAQNGDPRVRVAAASTARNLPPVAAKQVLAVLLKDPDFGVRKIALESERKLP